VALCPYCGRKVGWFEKAHEGCVREYKDKAAQAERARLHRQQQEARVLLLRETEEHNRREYQTWRSRHRALVDKFLEITERKVSLLDDYGDENWDTLPKEVETLLVKTARADNDDITQMGVLLFRDLKGEDFARAMRSKMKARFRPGKVVTDWVGLLTKYRSLKSNLELEFRSYHESRRHEVSTEKLEGLSGTEFETYLARMLKERGFEDVRGTPASGDQGGDLIARRNGRTIVIQAKRYQGTVGNRAVQEVAAAIKFYGADEGWVITTGTFTSSAKALAQTNNVKLIDGHALRNGQL